MIKSLSRVHRGYLISLRFYCFNTLNLPNFLSPNFLLKDKRWSKNIRNYVKWAKRTETFLQPKSTIQLPVHFSVWPPHCLTTSLGASLRINISLEVNGWAGVLAANLSIDIIDIKVDIKWFKKLFSESPRLIFWFISESFNIENESFYFF